MRTLNCIKDGILIDPPYNTGNDFVYDDDFKDPMARYKEVTSQTTKSNPESMGRFHTNWLNMMWPRLRLAANLLRDDGVIFISIDDGELSNLIKLCDDVFGEENCIGLFPRVTKKAGKSTETVARNHDYVVVYAKSDAVRFFRQAHTDEGFKNEDEFREERGLYKLNQTLDYDSLQYSPSLDYPIEIEGETFYPGTSYEKYLERQSGKYARADWAWRWSKELFDFGYANGFIVVKRSANGARIYTKTYQDAQIEKTANGFVVSKIERTKPLSSLEYIANEYSNDNSKKNMLSLFETSPFDYSKPISLIKALLAFATKDDDIVLDFFSGSATTAHAVMQLNAEDGGNRRFILVQLPELTDEKSEAAKAGFTNICEIGKERIRRAGAKITSCPGGEKLDTGFRVFKLDTSNIKIWNDSPIVGKDKELAIEILKARILDFVDPLVKGRTDADVVFEVALRLGQDLCEQITRIELDEERAVYGIGDDNRIIVCLAPNIYAEEAERIAEFEPGRVIFAEQCFKDTEQKANVRITLNQRGITIRTL